MIEVTKVDKDQEPITISEEAADKVAQFAEQSDAGLLRIGVRGGGCSGFQYSLALDEQRSGDLVFESQGQTILVSQDSYPYVAGSHITWKDELLEQGFEVENPKAVASCGCGSSFRIDDSPGCGTAEEGEYYL